MAGVVQSRRGGRVGMRGLRPKGPRLTPVFCFRPAESSRDGVKGSSMLTTPRPPWRRDHATVTVCGSAKLLTRKANVLLQREETSFVV